jgi:hypothetical protein
MLKFNNISISKRENRNLNIQIKFVFTEMLMVLVDLDRIQEMFLVLMDVYRYVILRFQREELESKEKSNFD